MPSLTGPHPVASNFRPLGPPAPPVPGTYADRVAELLRALGELTRLHPIAPSPTAPNPIANGPIVNGPGVNGPGVYVPGVSGPIPAGLEPLAEAFLRSEHAIVEIRDRLGAELRYENDRASALELVARQEPQDVVTDAILQMIVHQDPAASVVLFALDEAGLRLAACRGIPGQMAAALQADPPEADSPALAAAASGGKVVLTPSAAQLPNLDPFRQLLLAHGFRACAAWPAVCRDGQVLAILCLCLPLEGPPPDHARPLLEGAAHTAAIALESRRTYTELAYQAQHDTLTSLPNRLCFHDLTRQAVGSARRRAHRLALIRIDLDNFKHINDIFGHRGGDALLREVARRLRSAVRAADSVARMGGDEFAVLLHEVDGPDGAAQAARKLRALVAVPVLYQGLEISATGSVGVSLFPDHASDADSLLSRADAALDTARAHGRDCFHVFTPEASAGIHERITLEFQLRRALELNQFHLLYQPQFSASTRRITGVEALLRWNTPSAGLVPPDRFIPIAESLGVIVPIGRWALEQACRQAARWAALGHRLRMAVNVSAIQFARPDFTQTVLEVVGYTGIDPALLELELTESCLMCDPALVRSQMDALRAAGIRLSLDDFGTGYSSLSYLHHLPVDAIKIDRSFIRDLGTDSANARLVEAVVRLAQSLQLTVVAEGVENQCQLDVLSDLGCEYIQGFLFERPHTPESIEQLLSERR
ncbi:MAG: EAL domain-containing protein [Acidobacteria bacterium]|nr:EAL domain-containing protein [Acidobacteriota bacterium]